MVYIATPAVVNRFTFAAFISLGFNFVWIERNMMCKMCVYMKAVLSSKRMYATLTCFVPNKQKNQINKKIKRKWPERIDLLLFLWFFFFFFNTNLTNSDVHFSSSVTVQRVFIFGEISSLLWSWRNVQKTKKCAIRFTEIVFFVVVVAVKHQNMCILPFKSVPSS